jgi:hypothetical protein
MFNNRFPDYFGKWRDTLLIKALHANMYTGIFKMEQDAHLISSVERSKNSKLGIKNSLKKIHVSDYEYKEFKSDNHKRDS